MTNVPNGVSVHRTLQLQEELRTTKDELSKVTEKLKSLLERKKELTEKVSTIKTELKLLNEAESTPWTSFEGDSFGWSDEMKKTLKSIFHIDDFRSYQKAAINATMSGLDIILIMPTGTSQT